MARIGVRAGGLALSGALGATAVIAAAAAAHGPLASDLAATASHFQLFHALALAAAVLAPLPAWGHAAAAVLFPVGSLCFAGGLYSLAWLGVSWGPVVPLGGGLLILAWLLFAAAALKSRFAA